MEKCTMVILEQAAALEASAGVWRDCDHPDMASGEDIDRWLAELRGTADDRLARLADAVEGDKE
jgi:hypothetical protein